MSNLIGNLKNPLRLDAAEDKFVEDPATDPHGQIKGRNREIIHAFALAALAMLVIAFIGLSGAGGGAMSPGNGIFLGFLAVALLLNLKNIYIQLKARNEELETFKKELGIEEVSPDVEVSFIENFKKTLGIRDLPPKADYGFGDLMEETKANMEAGKDYLRKMFSTEDTNDGVYQQL